MQEEVNDPKLKNIFESVEKVNMKVEWTFFSFFLAEATLGSCHFSIKRDLCYDSIHVQD